MEAGSQGVESFIFNAEAQRTQRQAQRREMQSQAIAANARDLNEITHGIIAAAIEVHRQLGPGLLESAYQECVCYELSRMGIAFTREVHLPLSYKGLKLDCSYRIDLLVEDAILVELKAIEQMLPIHSAQLLTYLRASNKPIGLLINFNVLVLKDGIKRIVHDFAERGPDNAC
jgi:GxxExxY protein